MVSDIKILKKELKGKIKSLIEELDTREFVDKDVERIYIRSVTDMQDELEDLNRNSIGSEAYEFNKNESPMNRRQKKATIRQRKRNTNITNKKKKRK